MVIMKTMEEKLKDLNIKFMFKISKHSKISIKCVLCNEITIMNYVNYRLNIRKNNKTFKCKKCMKTIRYKETCLKKYGVENVSQVKSVQQKREETFMKNWGTNNHMKNKDFLKKYKKENLEKFGYETPFNSSEILQKCKDTVKFKYNVDNVFQLEKTKEKSKKTKLKKYGNENYNNIEKFKKTMILKYGTDNPSKLKSVLEKTKNTKIKNGYNYNDSDWHKYRLLVIKYTKKNISYLFNNWDGFDFYDKEYIAENLILNYNDKKYPTIDHIISLYDGYKLSILPKIISNIDNLCITKRTLNSKKSNKNKDVFIALLKN